MASVMGVENAVSSATWGRTGSAASKARARQGDARRAELASLVEKEIIPRLIVAHRDDSAANVLDTPARIDEAEAKNFATLPLMLEADALLEHVQAFLDRGVDTGSIMIDLLAPSARELGRLWEEDICSFVDVTMGLWRLQEVMREISWQIPSIADAGTSAPTALFCGMPGEQHSFGTLMIKEVFAGAGWHCEALIEISRSELLAEVQAKPFDLIGLTVSCDCHSATLEQLIRAVRSVSHNPQVKIMIGGRAINERPSLVIECGADGTAPDAQSALEFAEVLVSGTRRMTALAC